MMSYRMTIRPVPNRSNSVNGLKNARSKLAVITLFVVGLLIWPQALYSIFTAIWQPVLIQGR